MGGLTDKTNVAMMEFLLYSISPYERYLNFKNMPLLQEEEEEGEWYNIIKLSSCCMFCREY